MCFAADKQLSLEHNQLGLRAIFSLLSDPETTRQLEKWENFTAKDFTNLSGKFEVFSSQPKIIELEQELNKRTEWALNLDKQLNERTEWAKLLEKDVEKERKNIAEKTRKLEKQSEKINSLADSLQKNTKLLIQEKKILEEKKLHIDHLNHAILERNERIADREKYIGELRGSLSYRLGRLVTWPIRFGYEGGRLVLLVAKKWKIIVFTVISAVFHPVKFVKYFNRNNVKKFLGAIREENADRAANNIRGFFNGKLDSQEIPQIFKNLNTKKKLMFKEQEKPLVSIIIPVHNQWKYTYACLHSILQNTRDISYEIIVADDVSGDETKDIKKYIKGITVVHNKKNLGFLLNCNNAAKKARGRYIHLLNNDTVVQKNWLSSIVKLIESDKKTGLVGSKLVYPDGRLQEAGGIIWNDASGWNYGRLEDPSQPEFNYVKEVDYCSGASVLISKKLWDEIGGFDERYVPAYYEDTDLAFEVRKRGLKVMYQPKSVIIHFEGISHGRDENTGLKKHQKENQKRFFNKWRKELKESQFANGENIFQARDRSQNKKTIIVIDHYVPHFDKDAGSRMCFQYLKLFVEMGLNVKFIGDNFFKHEPYTEMLQDLGIEVLYGQYMKENWKYWVRENTDYLDIAYLQRPLVAEKYIDVIRKYTKAKVIYFGHDLHYLREQRRYEFEKDPQTLGGI